MRKMKKSTAKSDNYELQTIRDILDIEARDKKSMSLGDRIAGAITDFSGSMLYVILHVIWFGLWIPINLNMFGFKAFDPFPFSLLTMMVSLEAIFLSAFVLISQNKQSIQAEKRAKIDLQINMLAERETTKLIEMLAEVQLHLGIHKKADKEIAALKKITDISKLAANLEKEQNKSHK